MDSTRARKGRKIEKAPQVKIRVKRPSPDVFYPLIFTLSYHFIRPLRSPINFIGSHYYDIYFIIDDPRMTSSTSTVR